MAVLCVTNRVIIMIAMITITIMSMQPDATALRCCCFSICLITLIVTDRQAVFRQVEVPTSLIQ